MPQRGQVLSGSSGCSGTGGWSLHTNSGSCNPHQQQLTIVTAPTTHERMAVRCQQGSRKPVSFSDTWAGGAAHQHGTSNMNIASCADAKARQPDALLCWSCAIHC